MARSRMSAMEIHYEGSWAALYVDGKLVPKSVGDTYIAEEMVMAMLGVKVVHDNAFMRGQDSVAGVADTLEEVDAYKATRTEQRRLAQELRSRIAELEAQAEALESA